MSENRRKANATPETLLQIFTIPEAPNSTLSRIEQQLSQDLNGFLRDHIVAVEKPLDDIETDFNRSQIPEQPRFVSDHADELINNLVAHSVHTASPRFIGHMTSALPYFLLPLSKLMVGLNQNLVKIETSKAFTPMERQVIGMIHHLMYQQDDAFYQQWLHSPNHSLGAFCSGGTVANITALWVAKNRLLGPDGDFTGVAQEGLFNALMHYQYKGLAVLVSDRGHYSLAKAADLLGIGRKNIIAIKTDENHKVDVIEMRKKALELEQQGIKVMAIVGVAGTTETGNIDPLAELADLATELDCYFHVDAAWGGATMMSSDWNHLLAGIERADSITIDAHKQMYVPMGAGIVVFKQPDTPQVIQHHANYILREGSKDLGSHTLEGSRSGMAMLVNACFDIIGRQGYEILINQSLEKARLFADMIHNADDFELVTEPELCLLTYRFNPPWLQAFLSMASDEQIQAVNEELNHLTQVIQKRQREAGKTFVSRTTLTPTRYQRQAIIVFRVVLANPLTTKTILSEVLKEQREIASTLTQSVNKLHKLTA